ncbi:MAG: hypothetical protein J0L61_10190 [Planctomycetes bacterium]|nr:hypothetical protein [Planctomycetota bacterium]
MATVMPADLTGLWVAVLGGGAAVFAMLYALAARLGWEIELDKLRTEARALRSQYEERIKMIRAMGGHLDENE